MKTYREQLHDALNRARETGLRVRKSFNKIEFAKEFPKFAKDPRFLLTPPSFRIDAAPVTAVTPGEIREMAAVIGDHPLALHFCTAMDGYPDHHSFRILTQDYNVLVAAYEAKTKPKPQPIVIPPSFEEDSSAPAVEDLARAFMVPAEEASESEAE